MRFIFSRRISTIVVVAVLGLAGQSAVLTAQTTRDELPTDDEPPSPFIEVPEEPPPARPSRPSNSLLGNRQPIRSSRTPAMFGDFFAPGGTLASVGAINADFFADAPIGGGRHAKVAENNQALTDDRVYVSYNHFHNAFAVDTFTQSNQLPFDRVQFGYEKSFFDRLWSVELRLPLVSTYSFQPPGEPIGFSGGNLGNVSVIVKRMLYEGNNLAVAAGLGFDIPTGSDIEGFVGQNRVVVRNDAFHLLPYAGLLLTPTEATFVHAFAQFDLATNGNPIELQGSPDTGVFTEQNLFMFDVSAGVWLDRNPCRNFLTGLAAVFELHYTTSMQDGDFVFLFNPAAMNFVGAIGPADFGVLNMTAGLHLELANDASLRVAAVLPVKEDGNRFFDAELFLSYIKQL